MFEFSLRQKILVGKNPFHKVKMCASLGFNWGKWCRGYTFEGSNCLLGKNQDGTFQWGTRYFSGAGGAEERTLSIEIEDWMCKILH